MAAKTFWASLSTSSSACMLKSTRTSSSRARVGQQDADIPTTIPPCPIHQAPNGDIPGSTDSEQVFQWTRWYFDKTTATYISMLISSHGLKFRFHDKLWFIYHCLNNTLSQHLDEDRQLTAVSFGERNCDWILVLESLVFIAVCHFIGKSWLEKNIIFRYQVRARDQKETHFPSALQLMKSLHA